MYCFSYKRNPHCKHEEWGVPLPDLSHAWTEMCVDGYLHPVHKVSSFIRDSSDPVANIVSAVDLLSVCPGLFFLYFHFFMSYMLCY